MPRDKPTISFLGAAETVTGSRYLIDAGGVRVLVDCGFKLHGQYVPVRAHVTRIESLSAHADDRERAADVLRDKAPSAPGMP